MKKLTTLFLSLASTALMAQNIPNPSFETWAGGVPTSWNSISHNIVAATVTQSATKHHAGSSSAELTSQQFAGNYYGGDIETGATIGETYYLYTGATNPAALSGWYQLNANGGDYFQVVISTKTSGGVSGGQTWNTSTNTAVWKQFDLCINYSNHNPLDSVSILIQLSANHANDSAWVDDLSFAACGLDVPTIDPTNVTLEPAYPNPANTVCNIIYTLPGNGNVSADLYDISGRKLMNLLTNSKQDAGRYKIPVDVTSLANGIYIYRIVVDGQTYTQKFTVAK